MKNFKDDKKLKALIKSIDIDRPENGFSTKVMNQIFEMESNIEKLRTEPVLGKSFWIITSAFVVLILAIILIPENGMIVSDGQLSGLFNQANEAGVADGYKNAYEKITSLPMSIAGILFASSLLVFFESFVGAKNKIRS